MSQSQTHPTEIEFTALKLTDGTTLEGPFRFASFGAGAMYAGFWNSYYWVPFESVVVASF